ncbi:MAG: ATP-binding cassette domain-containing protein [Gemmatimonadetes bacterium]|nr:ATP-binding cassette domain-containing protein [Gemmatimonadota bacterium]
MNKTGVRIEARDVFKRYGPVTALAGVSLVVEPGSVTALVGESGSGKTTLLRCFNRMVEPEAGSISVGGRDLSHVDPVALRHGVGYVQQDGGLLPHWNTRRNAGMVPWLRGDPEFERRADEALNLVGLPANEFGARWPRALSGGQRQRAALARGLAGRPDILLLDEPFGALDAITRVDIQRTFRALQSELRVTVILVTHDLREAFHLADRVAVMKSGSIEQEATVAELQARPTTDYVSELLDKAGAA